MAKKTGVVAPKQHPAETASAPAADQSTNPSPPIQLGPMQYPGLLPQQQPGVPTLPPTQHAGHLLLATGIGEISVMFGRTRLSPVMQPNGQNTAQGFVEWFTTISLSAPIARQLCDGLKQTLDQYEKIFGPIPKPPAPPAAKKR